MIYKAYTVVFEGVEARSIEVQCALSAGLPGFSIIGSNCKPIFDNDVLSCSAFTHSNVFTTQSFRPLNEALQPSGGKPFYLSSSVVKDTMD